MTQKPKRYHPRYCWGAGLISRASGYRSPDWYLTAADCPIEVEIELGRSDRSTLRT
jgi:hypothetical protein